MNVDEDEHVVAVEAVEASDEHVDEESSGDEPLEDSQPTEVSEESTADTSTPEGSDNDE
jgi:hypothetical protein